MPIDEAMMNNAFGIMGFDTQGVFLKLKIAQFLFLLAKLWAKAGHDSS